jgi:hypothetical protein
MRFVTTKEGLASQAQSSDSLLDSNRVSESLWP